MADWTNSLNQTSATINQIAMGIQSSNLNKSNLDWQEKMYDLQKNDARENWNMQNEYNSPANQKKRLEEAGINPNQGDWQQAYASTPLNGTVPNTPNTILPSYYNPVEIAQIHNLNAQTHSLEAQTKAQDIANEISEKTKESDIAGKILDTKTKDVNWQFLNETFGDRAYITNFQKEVVKNEFKKGNVDVAMSEILLMYFPQKIESEMKILQSDEKLKSIEAEAAEMAKYLTKEYGIQKDAGDAYNIATILLNPESRKNIVKNLNLSKHNPFSWFSSDD